jgi:hypothetical protein
MRKLVVSALNIKIHPHTPELYIDLFNSLFTSVKSVKIRGADYGTPGWISEVVPGRPLDGLQGEFYKFLSIDPRDPWFDERSREVIEIDDDEDELPVPEHLKPNLHKVRFVFYPKKHRLFFDSQKFSPNNARKLLVALCSFTEITDKYGHVDVEVESSREAIERILEIPAKTKLEIRISLPNPDDTSDDEQRVLDRLLSQNARTIEESYTGVKEEGLIPNEDTKTLMRVAQSNGYVKATGYDGDKRIERSTLDHPLVEPEFYNPETTSRMQTLITFSQQLMANVLRL